MKLLIRALVLCVFLGLSVVYTLAYAAKASICPPLLNDQVSVQEFFGDTPYRLIRKANSHHPEDLYPDYSPQDVFIGVFAGHTYFLINGYRFDGGMHLNFSPSKIRQRNELTSGVIIRIKNVPNEIASDLMERLSRREKPLSITCSAGVCRYLEQSGLVLPGVSSFVPSRFLKSIIENGIETADGEVLQFDITVLGMRSIQRSLTYNRIFEAIFAAFNPAVVGAAMIYLQMIF